MSPGLVCGAFAGHGEATRASRENQKLVESIEVRVVALLSLWLLMSCVGVHCGALCFTFQAPAALAIGDL